MTDYLNNAVGKLQEQCKTANSINAKGPLFPGSVYFFEGTRWGGL